MITLNEAQLKELQGFLDTIPHIYARSFLGLLQKFAQENAKENTKPAEEVKAEEVE